PGPSPLILVSLKYQPAKNLRDVKVSFFSARWLPREITASGIPPDTAKQIDAPSFTTLRLVNPVVPGNAHPNSYSILLDVRGRGHVRLKLPIGFALRGRPMNRHVQPLACGRCFKFQIALDHIRI